MDSLGEWVDGAQTIAISLSRYGFDLTNREWAGIVWLVVVLVLVTGLAVSNPQLRSGLIGLLKITSSTKLIPIWFLYSSWIVLFVWIADLAGLWRLALTKDTVVWSATAGLVLLLGFVNADELGYFRREVHKIAGLTLLFEYVVNTSSFLFWIELALQPLIFLFLAAPSVAQDARLQEKLHRTRTRVFTLFGAVVLFYTFSELYAARQTIDWSYFALQATWPLLMGSWVLLLLFPLAIIAGYEEAFHELRRNRDKRKGLWKAKLGLVLALGLRLSLIRDAANGGTYEVANADSVGTAYEAANRFENCGSCEKTFGS